VSQNGSPQSYDGLAKVAEEVVTRGFRNLRFPKFLEHEFIKHHSSSLFLHSRFFILSSILLVSVFGLFDSRLLGGENSSAFWLRYGFMLPLMGAAFIVSLWRGFRRIQHWVSLVVLLSCGGTTVFMANIGGENSLHYFATLMVIMVYGNMLLRVRFWHALATTVSLYVGFVVSALYTGQAVHELFSYYLAIMSIVAFGCVFANYQSEYQLRQAYLQELLLLAEKEKLEAAQADLYRLSVLDSLTGLYNRRYFNETFARIWRDAYATQQSVALLFIDVDRFKSYNDTYGHQAGDRCLRSVADVLQRLQRRAGDLTARYGGEEFVIALPGMDLDGTVIYAENLRKQVVQLAIPNNTRSGRARFVTVSIGVSVTVPSTNIQSADLIRQADQALYDAKEQGRNKVCVAVESLDPASGAYRKVHRSKDEPEAPQQTLFQMDFTEENESN